MRYQIDVFNHCKKELIMYSVSSLSREIEVIDHFNKGFRFQVRKDLEQKEKLSKIEVDCILIQLFLS